MFGFEIHDLALLERLSNSQETFDPENPFHTRLLDLGLIVALKGDYYPMPTDSFYSAHEFMEDVARLQTYTALTSVKGRQEVPGVRVEFGVMHAGSDLTTGQPTPLPSPTISIEGAEATPRGIVDEMEATHAPIPEEVPAPVEAPRDGSYTEEMTKQFTQEQVNAGLLVEESVQSLAPEGSRLICHPESARYFICSEADLGTLDPLCEDVTGIPHHEDAAKAYFGARQQQPTPEPTPEIVPEPISTPERDADGIPTFRDADGIPTFDDTRQWERTIGDLPQAYEALRPAVRLLVKAGLEDHLFTKIYTAAFRAKELGRHREFIKDFTSELAAKLNSEDTTVNTWFEPWLHAYTKRVLSFDASEEIEAAMRFIMKHVPDDRKVEVLNYLQIEYINKGIARMFPEAVRRFKSANERSAIAKPVSWITRVAKDLHLEAERDQKRPPACDPALIDVAMALLPPVLSERERGDIRERLEYRLTNFGGISMDEILTAWETGFGANKMPALRYSVLSRHLNKTGKLYLTTQDAIVQTAKEIVYYLLAFVEQPREEPIGPMTWQESNQRQLAWVKAVGEVIEDVEFKGEPVFLKAWNKFINEVWQENKVKLTAKEAW